eukprot:GEMP01021145.1.p1 GENE.GEMP01021145.1~~GEMP01021145.1.p1  ORF type:complete len:469 (+),score=87.14 GEMP01021145.1:48-1454(+)
MIIILLLLPSVVIAAACDACLKSGGTWQPDNKTCTDDCSIQDTRCFRTTCPILASVIQNIVDSAVNALSNATTSVSTKDNTTEGSTAEGSTTEGSTTEVSTTEGSTTEVSTLGGSTSEVNAVGISGASTGCVAPAVNAAGSKFSCKMKLNDVGTLLWKVTDDRVHFRVWNKKDSGWVAFGPSIAGAAEMDMTEASAVVSTSPPKAFILEGVRKPTTSDPNIDLADAKSRISKDGKRSLDMSMARSDLKGEWPKMHFVWAISADNKDFEQSSTHYGRQQAGRLTIAFEEGVKKPDGNLHGKKNEDGTTIPSSSSTTLSAPSASSATSSSTSSSSTSSSSTSSSSTSSSSTSSSSTSSSSTSSSSPTDVGTLPTGTGTDFAGVMRDADSKVHLIWGITLSVLALVVACVVGLCCLVCHRQRSSNPREDTNKLKRNTNKSKDVENNRQSEQSTKTKRSKKKKRSAVAEKQE